MKKHLRPLADGILFQFLMVGSLSFSHIHDVAAGHGQAGWKSWLYPLSIDLLTVAAFRKIRAGKGSFFSWLAFLLGVAASLAANIIDSWGATPVGRGLDVAIGVWPAVALLVCTLLAHDDATHGTATVASPATATPVATATVQRPATAAAATPATPVATPVRQTVAATGTTPKAATVTARATAAKPTASTPSGLPRVAINRVVLGLLATHGTEDGKVTSRMVAEAIGAHKATGNRHLNRVRDELAKGKLQLPAMSSSLSSPTLTPTTAP